MNSPAFFRDLLAPPEAYYPSREVAIAALSWHAKWHGYAISVTHRNGTKSAHIRCSKWTKNVSKVPATNHIRHRRSEGNECPWEVRIYAVARGLNTMVYTQVICGHHGDPQPHRAFLKPDDHHTHRRFTELALNSIKVQVGRGVTAATLLTQHQGETAFRKDFQNACQYQRTTALDGKLPVEGLLHWLPRNGFWFKTRSGTDGSLNALFFTTMQCIEMAREFGTVMLMDATYKINKYSMPLFNIVGFDCNYRTFTVAWCFMSEETTKAYQWTLLRLQETLHPHGGPKVINTDAQPSLMAAIQLVFPRARQMLCIWHINECILRNCRKGFTAEAWPIFQSEMKDLMYVETQEGYDDIMERVTLKYDTGKPLDALTYCKTEWFDKFPDKFIYCLSKDVVTFNSRATNRVEGAHGVLKRFFLRSSLAKMNENCVSLKESLRVQQSENYAVMAKCYGWMAPWIYEDEFAHMFSLINDKVTHYALDLIRHEWLHANEEVARGRPPQLPCTCRAFHNWGVPCRHQIHYLRGNSAPFTLNDIATHWHLPSDARILELWPDNPFLPIPDATTPDSGAPHASEELPPPPPAPTEPVRPRRVRGKRANNRRIRTAAENVLQEVGVTERQLRAQARQRRRARTARNRQSVPQQASQRQQTPARAPTRQTLTLAQAQITITGCIHLATENGIASDIIGAATAAANEVALTRGTDQSAITTAFRNGMLRYALTMNH